MRSIRLGVVCFCLLGLSSCAGGAGETVGSEEIQPASEPVIPVSDTGSPRFWAEPNVIQACEGLGKTRIHWNVEGVSRVEIRIGRPSGNLFVVEGPKGSAETGQWVKDGTEFYLLDGTTKEVLEAIRVRLTAEGC